MIRRVHALPVELEGRAPALDLRLAIDRSERLRALAAEDSDFDPIREEPGFRELER